MMNMKRIANLMLVALVLGTFIAQAKPKVVTEGAALGEWSMDIDAVMALAKEKEVPVILLFTGSDWCQWCKVLDENLLSDEQWQKYAAGNLALGYLDFPKDEEKVPEKYRARNEELSKKYNIEGYPTMVLLDWGGREVARPTAPDEEEVKKFINALNVYLLKSPLVFAKKTTALSEEEGKRFHGRFDELTAGEQRLKELQEELQRMKEELDKKVEEFGKKQEEVYDELLSVLFDRKFPERAGELKAQGEKADSAKDALVEWLKTEPEQNEENKKIFDEKMDELEKYANSLNDLLFELFE